MNTFLNIYTYIWIINFLSSLKISNNSLSICLQNSIIIIIIVIYIFFLSINKLYITIYCCSVSYRYLLGAIITTISNCTKLYVADIIWHVKDIKYHYLIIIIKIMDQLLIFRIAYRFGVNAYEFWPDNRHQNDCQIKLFNYFLGAEQFPFGPHLYTVNAIIKEGAV